MTLAVRRRPGQDGGAAVGIDLHRGVLTGVTRFGAGAGDLHVDYAAKTVTAKGSTVKAGDIITKADDADISSPGRLSMAVRAAFVNQKPIALKLVRNKQALSLTVTLEPLDWRDAAPKGQVVKQPSR